MSPPKGKKGLFLYFTQAAYARAQIRVSCTHTDMPHTLMPYVYIYWKCNYTMTSILGNEPRQTFPGNEPDKFDFPFS